MTDQNLMSFKIKKLNMSNTTEIKKIDWFENFRIVYVVINDLFFLLISRLI